AAPSGGGSGGSVASQAQRTRWLRLLRLTIVIIYSINLLWPLAANAQTSRTRAKVIFDWPPNRIEKVVSGQSLALSIPLHTTGDLKGPTFTLWSRGVTVASIRTDIGDLASFSAASISIRVTAPARIPPGLYPVTVQVRDQQNVR